MKKYMAICATLVALAWAGVATAAAPQGRLTGSATIVSLVATLTITTPVLDGGTTYVGLENDKSANCSGDTGTVTLAGISKTIVCAHFVAASADGSGPKMRFAIQSLGDPTCYYVFRISDGGATDKVGVLGICGSNALGVVKAIVNKGSLGGGGFINGWTLSTVDGYTVTPIQDPT